MIRNLLVPLDGSTVAETAAPAAARLARAMGARVWLLHVIEQNAPKQVHSERHLTTPAEAEMYLRQTAERYFPAPLEVSFHVHTEAVRDVAKGIYEHTGELAERPDLIVMTMHGKTGPVRWLFGSIAQQVVAMGSTPLLMLPPSCRLPRETGEQRFLVPVGGNPAHAGGLGVAVELAKGCGATVRLVTVVEKTGNLAGGRGAAARMLPMTAAALLEMEEQSAKEWVGSLAKPFTEAGVETSTAVLRGDPAGMVLAEAERMEADLLVLCTHGRAGTAAFWSGSVASRIAVKSTSPILFVPIRGE